MKILIASARDEDVSARAIGRALATGRHEVVELDYEALHAPTHLSPRFRRVSSALRATTKWLTGSETALADARLVGAARKARFDAIVVLRVNLIPASTIAALRATGALVIGWFMDTIWSAGDAPFLAAPYSALFLKDPVVAQHFRTITARQEIDYLAQGFDPTLHRPIASAALRCDVALYGNGYPYRAHVLSRLLESDMDVRVYGRTGSQTPSALARRYRPPVWGLDKSRAMREARIALNTQLFAEIGGTNKRTFELCGMGAFQLTDGVNVGRYFDPSRELATFAGPEDLIVKVRHYVERDDERARIASAGLARAWREHTWAHRLNEMFQRIPALRGERPLPVPVPPGHGTV